MIIIYRFREIISVEQKDIKNRFLWRYYILTLKSWNFLTTIDVEFRQMHASIAAKLHAIVKWNTVYKGQLNKSNLRLSKRRHFFPKMNSIWTDSHSNWNSKAAFMSNIARGQNSWRGLPKRRGSIICSDQIFKLKITLSKKIW